MPRRRALRRRAVAPWQPPEDLEMERRHQILLDEELECEKNTDHKIAFITGNAWRKSIYSVPGIGCAYGDALHRQGWTKASQLIGYYLYMDESDAELENKLLELGVIRLTNRCECVQAIRDYFRNQ